MCCIYIGYCFSSSTWSTELLRDIYTVDKCTMSHTSSSAVAKRPCSASYLSVVSFNSTKHRVESFIFSYVGYRFITACSYMRCSVVYGVTSRLLVINILSSSPTINTATYYQRCVINCEMVAVVHRRLC